MLKKILRSAGSDALKYFPMRLVPALTSLVTVPVFSRLIERADYGDFYLVNSAVSLTATLATAWLNASIVRFYWAEEKEGRLDAYVSTIVWLSFAVLIVGAAVLGAIFFFLRGAFPETAQRLVPIALAGLVSGQFIVVMQQLLRAANKPSRFAMLSVVSNLIATALAVYFVAALHWGSLGILAGVVVGNTLMLPLALRYAHAEGSISVSHVSADTARQFAVYGIPMIPAAISSWVLVLSDRYIIGLTQSASELGLYGTAYNLGDKLMGLITAPMLIAIGPVLIQTFEKEGPKLAQQVQTQLTRYFAMVTVPLVFGLIVVAKSFMQVFVGPLYRSAYGILPIIAAGVLLYGMSQIASNGLALHKKTVIMMQNTLIAAAVQVTLNLFLVPKYGYRVAAWTTLLSYALILLLAWVRSRPYLAWRVPVADLARIAVASGTMAVVILFVFRALPVNVWVLGVEVLAGLVVYVLALWALRGLRPDEIQYAGEVWAAVRRRMLRSE